MYKCECGGKKFQTVKKNEAYRCRKCNKVDKHQKIESEWEKKIRERNEKNKAQNPVAPSDAAAAPADIAVKESEQPTAQVVEPEKTV